MKNVKQEPGDSLRPEYRRSDFGEMVQGKHAKAEVELAELVRLLLACIGEDEGLTFIHFSRGNQLGGRQRGAWTYELNATNQITLCYWRTEAESLEEVIVNPPHVTDSQGRSELQNLLVNHVRVLKARVNAL